MNDPIRTSAESAKVCAAFVAAQAAMPPAKKDAKNPHFKSTFASLQSVRDACDGPLQANKLALLQSVTEATGGVCITTRIIHESGEWIEAGPAFFPASKNDAQGYGSATTYGKRYALSAMLGIVADDDDDGNAASKRGDPAGQSERRPAAAPTSAAAEPPDEDEDYAKAARAIDTAPDAAALNKRWSSIAAYYADDARTLNILRARADGRRALWSQAPQGAPA